MYRSLVNQKGSLTLTLPKSWVEKNKLQPKDQVFIQEFENQLVIESESSTAKKVKELDVREIPAGTLRSLVGSLYRSGYDELLFTGVTPAIEKESFSHLVGAVVTNEGSYHKVTFMTKEDKDVMPILDKMFITIGVALESEKADMKQLRMKALELKDFLSRSIIKFEPTGDGEVKSGLASHLNKFVSYVKELDSVTESQISDFMKLQKMWLKRDFTSSAKFCDVLYKKRKDPYYDHLMRVASQIVCVLV